MCVILPAGNVWRAFFLTVVIAALPHRDDTGSQFARNKMKKGRACCLLKQQA
jgi:hypothetical protein